MLVGRAEECDQLRRMIADAGEERAAVLVLRGEAGIGKTTLLRFATEAADGFRVLPVQGHESEAETPFAGLSWLFEPLTALVRELPPRQAQALNGALYLGPATGGDRLAVAVATLTLLAAAADERPLLVAIDDAHWLDVPSLEAIVFAARRLQAESIALVLTARPPEDVPAEVNRLLEALPEMVVAGLDTGSARELLAAQRTGLSLEVLDGRVAEAAGNPLALLELSTLGEHALPVEPLRIGRRLEQTFGRRVGALLPSTRQAMLLLAAAGASAADVLGRALALQGLSASDLEPAETAGLLVVDRGNVRFLHPLVRSALYQSASPAERRAAHRAIAEVFSSLSTPRAQEQYACHLAVATLGPDEAVAAALDNAAEAAAARRSYATAMDMHERSARLSPPGDTRARRLLNAAHLSFAAGRQNFGLTLLHQVLEETSEWRLRAEAQQVRCRIEMWGGQPVVGRDMLIAEADRVEAADPAWSAIMRAQAALMSAALGEQRLAATAARQAVEALADLPDSITMPALVIYALTLATGGDVPAARSVLARCEPHLASSDPLANEQILLVAALAWESLEEPAKAMRLLEHAVSSAREASAVGLLPYELRGLALVQWHYGNWAAAYANAHDAVGLAEETDRQIELQYALVTLAAIEAGMGHAGNCQANAARAITMSKRTGAQVFEAHAANALALLELGNGNAPEAARHLEFAGAFATSHGLRDPVLLNWAGDLVEALVKAGETSRGLRAHEVLAAEAERTGRPTEAAVAARCQGLLAKHEEAMEEAFAQALGWHARAVQPFQEARTRLLHGELLRRHRRRAEARAELAAALALFDRLGAEPWSAQARDGLRATGLTARPRNELGPQQLTPQELRIALAVAEGATNVEAAAQLFVSAKTVEYHLSSVYRKLGIRSRTQLVRLLSNGPRPALA
jgi:DNA-binding CsgD family transcriptional regulator